MGNLIILKMELWNYSVFSQARVYHITDMQRGIEQRNRAEASYRCTQCFATRRNAL